ncbi:MAG: hypothetical protein LBF85_07940 [Tannerella sp.]|jgi:SAM-dependent methyltransferase|nr:hypothetical protein [Tannerella sp.]
MNTTPFEYTGTSNLEVMQEAVKYNSFLASLILNRTQSPQRMLDIGAGIGALAKLIRDAGHNTVVYMEPDVQQAALLKAKGFEVHTLLDDIPDYADCIGFLATLLYKLTDKSGRISRKKLLFYDRYCFPPSRIGDLLFGKLFGKNVFIIAGKTDVSKNNKVTR